MGAGIAVDTKLAALGEQFDEVPPGWRRIFGLAECEFNIGSP